MMTTATKTPLAEAMGRSGLKQRQIAAALGVSEQAVAGWKTGRRRPPIDKAVALADLLQVDVKTIFPKKEAAHEDADGAEA